MTTRWSYRGAGGRSGRRLRCAGRCAIPAWAAADGGPRGRPGIGRRGRSEDEEGAGARDWSSRTSSSPACSRSCPRAAAGPASRWRPSCPPPRWCGRWRNAPAALRRRRDRDLGLGPRARARPELPARRPRAGDGRARLRDRRADPRLLHRLLRRRTRRTPPRSAALLLAFAGAMLGLVLADDLLTLYLFWELTSVTSFLLVGQSGEARENRSAAVQALLVTVFGGLVMLLGFVLLGEAAGTYRISEIVALGQAGAARRRLGHDGARADPLGALTKSAQLPFHPWLPGRDGRADAGERLPARGVDGEGGRVPRGPALAGIRGPRRVVGARRRARPGARCCVGGWRALRATRPQAAARLRHRQPARLPHGPLRSGHPDRGHRRDRDAARARALQGAAVPRHRHHRPRDRHPGRAQALRTVDRRCAAAPSPPARRPRRWPGCRRCSASSARRPGSRRSSPRTTCAAGSSRSRWSRARCSPWPTAPGSSGARSPASPASADTPVHRPGPLLTVAGRALRARRARARHREPRGRRRRAELRRRLPGHLPGGGRLPPRAVARPRPAAAGVRRRARARLRTAPRVEPGRPARRPHAARAVGAARLRARRRRHRARRHRRHRPAAGRAPSPPTSPSSSLTVVALPGTAVLVGGSWPDQPVYHAPLQLPLAVLVDARGARPGAGAPPVHRGAAGRGGRLRRRRAVHRRRCPRPRAGPVPRRDPVAGRVRLRAAPDARPGSPGAGCGRGSRCPRP